MNKFLGKTVKWTTETGVEVIGKVMMPHEDFSLFFVYNDGRNGKLLKEVENSLEIINSEELNWTDKIAEELAKLLHGAGCELFINSRPIQDVVKETLGKGMRGEL